MRAAGLFALLFLSVSGASSQQSTETCGAPDPLTPDRAQARLLALAPRLENMARDPYETTAQWEKRRAERREEAQRAALTAFSFRTLRVGGRVPVRYDADSERLYFNNASWAFTEVDVPADLTRTQMMTGASKPGALSTASFYGIDEGFADLRRSTNPASIPLSRTRAHALDVASSPVCAYQVYRVFGADIPVVGLDRFEIVVMVDGQPHVWTSRSGDDGTTESRVGPPSAVSPSSDGPPGPPSPPLPPPPELPQDDYVLDFAEVQPEPIGGMKGLWAGLVYPEREFHAKVGGRVIVQFIVERDGTPSTIVVARRVSPGLDQAVVDAIRQARFAPGTQNGQAVRTRMSLPVTFRTP